MDSNPVVMINFIQPCGGCSGVLTNNFFLNRYFVKIINDPKKYILLLFKIVNLKISPFIIFEKLIFKLKSFLLAF